MRELACPGIVMVVVLAVWLLAGWCVSPADATEITVPLDPMGDVTNWPGWNWYWHDIYGNEYSQDFQDAFTYEDADVYLTCQSWDPTYFRARIHGTALKPSFAYQLKLVGKPTKDPQWGSAGDDWSNEQIGYSGRWWRDHPDPNNANDNDYNAHYDDPDYLYHGYLLMDFCVSDEAGAVDWDLKSDSSYHVLWKTSQRGHEANDGPIRYYPDEANPVEGIYAEWEPGRATPGTLELPEGPYNVQFVLTEESWHDPELWPYGWESPLGAPTVMFSIPEPSGVALAAAALAGCVAALKSRRRRR